MRITNIKASNIFGARYVDLDLDTPITLFAGRNGAGKSSIQEGVRMAFSGDTTRVKLKRDYGLIVSEGAKSGEIFVTTDEGTAGIAMPKGTHILDNGFEKGLPDALPYVLNAQAFAKMKEDDRRTFLFGLTNSQITEEVLKRMLKDAKCDDQRVAMVMPMMKSIVGFPAAEKFAAGKATEAKGTWQGVTGEKYGSKKGETWQAEVAAVDADDFEYWQQETNNRREDLNEASEALGALKAQQKRFVEDSGRREVLEARFARVASLKEKLDAETSALLDHESLVADLSSLAGDAPKVGMEHDFARAVEFALDALGDDQRASIKSTVAKLSAPFTVYVSKHGLPSNAGDAEAREKLPLAREKLTVAKRNVQTTAAALKECEACGETLKQLVLEPVSSDAIIEGEAIVTKVQAHLDEAVAEFNKLDAIRQQAVGASKRTADAAAAHADVMEWSKLAEQLGADGIPAQILAKALKPINTELRKSSLATGWRQAAINPDMTITAEGRIYDLLCESEQWRVDAMIAEAIASLSGIGVLVLDRVDVLEIPARVELLLWLDGRAKEGFINTALLFATLKGVPNGLPATINAVWLEAGEIVEQAIAA